MCVCVCVYHTSPGGNNQGAGRVGTSHAGPCRGHDPCDTGAKRWNGTGPSSEIAETAHGKAENLAGASAAAAARSAAAASPQSRHCYVCPIPSRAGHALGHTSDATRHGTQCLAWMRNVPVVLVSPKLHACALQVAGRLFGVFARCALRCTALRPVLFARCVLFCLNAACCIVCALRAVLFAQCAVLVRPVALSAAVTITPGRRPPLAI